MKKLVSLFLWFCAATFLAQICILGLAASKGRITRNTIAQVIGLLNGIDIQSERLKQALISVRDTPTPTYDDVVNAKTNAVLQLDSRSGAVEKLRRQLADQHQYNTGDCQDSSNDNACGDLHVFEQQRA